MASSTNQAYARGGRVAIVAAAVLVSGVALLSGCGSSDETSPTTTRSAGPLSKDVIAAVCNMSPETFPATMTSTRPGKSPTRLTTGNCLTSRPPDAGGDRQESTSLGNACDIIASVTFPGQNGQGVAVQKFGFFNNALYSGVELGAVGCKDDAIDTTPGSATVVDLHGYALKVYQERHARYAVIGVDIYPKGTALSAMK